LDGPDRLPVDPLVEEVENGGPVVDALRKISFVGINYRAPPA
jgi:hypothetical protein